MKVSLKWLRNYVDVTIPVKDLAERLTSAGLEVSGVEIIGKDWDNITIASIVNIKPHPNADRLRLATVNLKNKEMTVVCGAPNLNISDKVAFAQVGAKLIDGHSGELIQLKPAKIRGVYSEGMICSEKELGISDSHDGILVLPVDASVGAPLFEYLGDTILDIDITSNRPDCLSVIGIAREVAALTKSKFHMPSIDYIEQGDAIESIASIKIVDPDLCPRYCASLLTNVKVGPSPQWMQQRLLSCGMRPISNVVDITNYVMMEYGQPLHAFDFKELKGQQIIVRRARNGEVITTLDGAERALKSSMLLISDKERAVAVAGVMGGSDTEVSDRTTAVLIESANFNRTAVHSGSIDLKLVSEASLRFEKGLSPELAIVALKRATQLMQEMTGAEVAKGIIDVYPGKQELKSIVLPAIEVKRLLGVEISMSDITEALELLGFNCRKNKSSQELDVEIPWWRTDISCKADLVEEVARIYGYENIPTSMLSSSLPSQELVPILKIRNKIRTIMASCGFQEILTYSLTNEELINKILPQLNSAEIQPLKVSNPMSKELECLRTTLRSGVLTMLSRNQKYQQRNYRLFELGKIFLKRKETLPEEREILCAVLTGLQAEVFWQGNAKPVDFFVAKGVAETLLSKLGLAVTFLIGEDAGFCPGKNAIIASGGETLGVVGKLHPKVIKAFDLSEEAYVIELNIDKVAPLITTTYQYHPILKYPSVIRDIALVIDEQIAYQKVYNLLCEAPLVTRINLFDLYRGEQVPPGKKSLAIRLVYQSNTRTLSDAEVDVIQQQILDRLTKELGATLRI
jgi:phenylalanyl-tRNA synthetase beta chain